MFSEVFWEMLIEQPALHSYTVIQKLRLELQLCAYKKTNILCRCLFLLNFRQNQYEDVKNTKLIVIAAGEETA